MFKVRIYRIGLHIYMDQTVSNIITILVLDVIICQAVVRRALSLRASGVLRYQLHMTKATTIQRKWRIFAASKHEHQMANATTIQAKWRSHAASKVLSKSIVNIKILQSVVRSWLVRKNLNLELQKMAATKISACWKSHLAQMAYKRAIQDIVVCQSIGRRKIATNLMLVIQHEYHVTCITAIQALWKAYIESKRFVKTVRKVVIIQSVFRMNVAVRYLDSHQEAATKISATWRACSSKVIYQQIILCE